MKKPTSQSLDFSLTFGGRFIVFMGRAFQCKAAFKNADGWQAGHIWRANRCSDRSVWQLLRGAANNL